MYVCLYIYVIISSDYCTLIPVPPIHNRRFLDHLPIQMQDLVAYGYRGQPILNDKGYDKDKSMIRVSRIRFISTRLRG